MDKIEERMQNREAALKSIENQVGQISQALNRRPLRGFPSDTEVAKGATHEQCKTITTRSGKNLSTQTRTDMGKRLLTKPMQKQFQINLPWQIHYLPQQEKIKISHQTLRKQILKQQQHPKSNYPE
ncbi:hypothetical protein V6N12_045574 [Hibiscus sabdariffa]|uniref:Uncharacterized protein n=1 Tax=Hibiscus sabdariffa TaxID=183260 RepID=A0ABR2G3R4_9ROSI